MVSLFLIIALCLEHEREEASEEPERANEESPTTLLASPSGLLLDLFTL